MGLGAVHAHCAERRSEVEELVEELGLQVLGQRLRPLPHTFDEGVPSQLHRSSSCMVQLPVVVEQKEVAGWPQVESWQVAATNGPEEELLQLPGLHSDDAFSLSQTGLGAVCQS